MKKRKLKLEALEVNSFTTTISDREQAELNGGTTVPCGVGVTIVTAATVFSYITYTLTKPKPTMDNNDTNCPGPMFQTKEGHNSCLNGKAC